MTYLELYEDALRKLHNSLITLGEFEMMIKPLNREVESEIGLTDTEPKTDEWILIKWHEILEEEREQEGYPKDWVVFLDCEMPSDEQKILVTTRWGTVEADMCYEDGEFSLDSGYDWIEDIVAWMPMPEPYKGG